MSVFSAVPTRGKREVFGQCEYIKKRCKWELQLLCRAAASHFSEAGRCSTFLRALGSLSLLGPGSSNSLPWLLSVLAQNCSVPELPGCSGACRRWRYQPSPPPLSCVASKAFMFSAFFTKKVDPLFLCHLLL